LGFCPSLRCHAGVFAIVMPDLLVQRLVRLFQYRRMLRIRNRS
jgi:hypothetical protein